MQAVHTERGGVYLQRVNQSPVSPCDQWSKGKMVHAKKEWLFSNKNFASTVGTVSANKKEWANGKAISTLRDFFGLGVRGPVDPVYGLCRIQTLSDNWVNISRFLSWCWREQILFSYQHNSLPFYMRTDWHPVIEDPIQGQQHQQTGFWGFAQRRILCVRVCVCGCVNFYMCVVVCELVIDSEGGLNDNSYGDENLIRRLLK